MRIPLMTLLLAASLPLLPATWKVSGSVTYGYGTGALYDALATPSVQNGKPGTLTIRNKPGFGFRLDARAHLTDRLFLMPAVGMEYGNHSTTFLGSAPFSTATRSDQNYSEFVAEVNVGYALLRTAGIDPLYALAGLAFGQVTDGAAAGYAKKGQTALQAGLGADLIELNHFGITLQAVYRLYLGDDKASRLIAGAGILYRF
jgi:hypothetical protein